VTAPNAIRIGNRFIGATLWNGYVEGIAVWPTRRLSNPELQAVSQAQMTPQTPRAGKSMLVTGMQYNPGTRGLTLSLWG
jgi:hypothetical protein